MTKRFWVRFKDVDSRPERGDASQLVYATGQGTGIDLQDVKTMVVCIEADNEIQVRQVLTVPEMYPKAQITSIEELKEGWTPNDRFPDMMVWDGTRALDTSKEQPTPYRKEFNV